MTAPAAPAPSASGRLSDRVVFLDVARAAAVIAMLAANLVNVFVADRPRWLAHNVGDELLPFDLPAALFQFLVGMSLVLFLARRTRRSGRRAARWLAARRFVLLIALGIVLDAIWTWRLEVRWGVLQTLGLGGLVATVLADAADPVILACAAAILALHYGPGNNEVHRSAVDCLPFVPLTLLGYAVARPFAGAATPAGDAIRGRVERRLAAAGLTCVALAIALRLAGIPFNKVTGSSSFVAFAAGASATFVGAVAVLERRGVRFWPPFVRLGAHALTAWVLQYLLVFYPVDLVAGRSVTLPEASGLVVVTVVTIALSAATLALAKHGIRIPL